jgi:hypothetical protein
MAGSVRGKLIGRFAAALLLVGVGVLVGAFIAQRPDAHTVAMQLRSDRLAQSLARGEFEMQLQAAQSRIDQVQSEFVIERATRIELEKNLYDSQRDLGRLKDHLAFYEQLLPPGPQGAIDLRAIDVSLQGDALSYRVLLMRSGKPGERFNGQLEFVALGCQKNEQVTRVLGPLQSTLSLAVLGQDTQGKPPMPALSAELLRLDFEQFQRLQGMLALPVGFEPQSVTVRVLDGSIVLASSRVDL